ncbi:S41 family peptidase [Alkalibacillus aidingensis]|uniref:S41 family peptidase n=1 Tax=Alkalibacillus aidingensis TaxID=2747607 RepID=UPI0016617970|nr:S41 family peptidase [Alkalibacillus aidingensis]
MKRLNLLILLMITTLLLPTLSISANTVTTDDVRPFVESFYYEDVDPAIFDEDVETLFESLDPYSDYLTEEQLKQFEEDINQSFVGIGIAFEMVEDGVLIQNVYEGSPADEAELTPGDIITHVDGTSLANKSSDEASLLIAGEENTSVVLTVFRDDDEFDVEVTRESIDIPVVTSTRLGGDIGYLSIESFSDDLIDEVLEQVQSLNDVDSWILDLRFNSGGYLGSAQELLGMFPEVDTMMAANFNDYSRTYGVIKQDITFETPVSLLINQYSASASEIVAAALKDEQLATLYGETTFGKGLMQQIFYLDDGLGGVKLSVAEFLSPLGNKIHNQGVEPDESTDLPLEDAHWDQLNEQLEYDQFEQITEVSPNHQFTIALNDQANLSSLEEQIEFIDLGGSDVDFSLSQKDEQEYELTPDQSLEEDGEYAIYIHPGWENNEGNRSKEGVIVRVNVSE